MSTDGSVIRSSKQVILLPALLGANKPNRKGKSTKINQITLSLRVSLAQWYGNEGSQQN